MARITHVKKAQQRYETVPVLDENGEPVRTPVMRSDGTQKTTKHGRPVFMTKTKADKTKPLPELSCDFPGCDINGGKIAVGSSYKHITPKSGPYGGTQKNRHAEHPSWKVWEYSSSLSARVAQIVDGIETSLEDALNSATDSSDIDSVLEDGATEVDGLAEEKSEAADSMEEGFGHETSSSAERREEAEALEEWAGELRDVDVPDYPDAEGTRWFVIDTTNDDARVCDPEGYEEEDDAHQALADLKTDTEETDDSRYDVVEEDAEVPSEEQVEEWRDEVRSAVEDVLGNSPY